MQYIYFEDLYSVLYFTCGICQEQMMCHAENNTPGWCGMLTTSSQMWIIYVLFFYYNYFHRE